MSSEDRGPRLLAAVWTLHGIALIVVAVRIGSRLTPKFALTAADYTIVIALIAFTICSSFTTAAVANGFGKHTADMTEAGRRMVGTYFFAVFLSGLPAACFARISIACLLLQITLSRRWKALLWATIMLQALYMTVYYILQLSQCRSVISQQVKIDQTQCLTPKQVRATNHVNIGISMFSDLVCVVLPICLIRSLTRSPVEKALVALLLASSLLATACGIPKIYYTVTFDFSSPDVLYLMVNRFLWGRLEEGIIIIAACAPMLKVPAERAMARLGFATFARPVPNDFVMVSSARAHVCGEGRSDERLDSTLARHASEGGGSTLGGLHSGGGDGTGASTAASERSYHMYGAGHDQGLRV